MLSAGFGFDTVHGAADNDYVAGEQEDDILYGEGGIDWLWAGAGNDTLVGGDGADVLIGESGADVFAYTSISEFGDAILGVVWGEDVFDFSDFTFEGDIDLRFDQVGPDAEFRMNGMVIAALKDVTVGGLVVTGVEPNQSGSLVET